MIPWTLVSMMNIISFITKPTCYESKQFIIINPAISLNKILILVGIWSKVPGFIVFPLKNEMNYAKNQVYDTHYPIMTEY